MAVTSMTFDESFYLNANPDVLTAILNGFFSSAQQHFQLHGYKELRDPNSSFDTSYYLTANPDVLSAGVNPFDHFVANGASENRAPTEALESAASSFDSATYLTTYPDVQAAITAGSFTSAYQHWVLFGQYETRTAQTTDGTSLTGSGSGGTGSTFTLTTGLDSATSQTSVSGILSDTASERTWNLTDTVSGTSATTDAMSVRIIGDATGTSFSGLQTSAIETLTFQFTDGNDAAEANSIATGGFSGLSTLAVSGGSIVNTTSTTDDSLSFTSVAAGVALQVANNSTQLNVNYTGVGTDTSGDSVTLNTAGGSTGVVTFNDAAGDGYVTVNVATSGAANKLQGLAAGTDFTTLKVTGTSALTISDALASTVTSLDASGNTGAVVAEVTASSTLSAKGSSATTDKLTVNVASSVTTGASVSGFETLVLYTTAGATFDLDQVTGASAFQISQAGGTGQTLVLQDVAAGTAVSYVGSGSTTVDQTFNALTYSLKDATGTSDSAALAVNNGGTATTKSATTGLITAAGIETLSLAATDFKATTLGGLTATATKTLTLTGSSNLTTGTLSTAALETLDASAYTGDLTLGALNNTGQNSTVTTGSGKDSLTNAAVNDAGETQTISTGAGVDTITLIDVGNATATVDINAGEGDDIIQVSTDININTGVLKLAGGDGTDTLRIGAAVNGKTIDIDAFTGIEKINLENTAGAVTLDIDVATGYADSVLITDVSGQTNTINFNTTAGGTINLSNVTTLGWTSGTDILSVKSNSGNETFTFGATSSGSNISETYVLADTSATNGTDTIASFTRGAGGDVIAIKAGAGVYTTANNAAGGAGATGANVFTLATTAVNAANEIIVLNAATYSTSALAETALDTYAAATITATNDVIFIYSDGTNAHVYRDINAGTDSAGTDLTHLATLSGVDTTAELTEFAAGNFIFIA